jgi:glycosyltransferase involved in cell wall biosynthesis
VNTLFVVHTEASLGWGGQEIRILEEAQGFIARHHRVEIWADPASQLLPEAIRRAIPHRALPIGRKNMRGLAAMRHALAKARPAIVNTHSSTDAWLVALASLTLRKPPPMVRTRHISAPVPENWPTRWLYAHATRRVVTTGEALRETLIRENGLPPGNVTSVPTGVDGDRFHPGSKPEARRALGLDAGGALVGIVATLRSWKGHLDLVEAFSLVAPKFPDARLVIVGDGPMRDAIVARISERGLGSRTILAGRQQRPEDWLRALDLFCLPSYANEGVPQAIVQAMLTALPVVTTPVGSIGEAVTDGETALMVPPRDPPAIAAAIERLLGDPELGLRLGDAARRDASRRFGLDSMISRMEHVFRDCLDETGHGRRMAA